MLAFEKYPPGIRDLLKWAEFHLQQLNLLEREFRAWQAAQGESGTTVVHVNSQGQETELLALALTD